jgi:hypothetical protein
MSKELDSLRAFAQAVLQDMPEAYPDGFDLQDLAIAYGLYDAIDVTEPCSEACACAEYGDFPTTCYRRSALLLGSPQGSP